MLRGIESFSFGLEDFLANFLMLLNGLGIEHSAAAHSTLVQDDFLPILIVNLVDFFFDLHFCT